MTCLFWVFQVWNSLFSNFEILIFFSFTPNSLDPKWGQKIFALIVLKQKSVGSFSNDEFISWCKTRLPKYSVPKAVDIIEKMPRNQLGKVNKKELIKKYEAKKA